MKDFLEMIGVTVLACVLLAAIWIGGGFLGLWWYPYSIQRQTAIVRASNSYITAKQEELVSLYVGYTNAATEDQKKAIMLMMCQDAALIPGYVPASVNQVIAGDCR